MPLPQCLEEALIKLVLPLCPRDASHTVRDAIKADVALQRMLTERETQVRKLWAKADRFDGRPEGALGVRGFVHLLEQHKAFRSVSVQHKSLITGDPRSKKEYTTNFSVNNLHECFLDSCAHLMKAATVPLANAKASKELKELTTRTPEERRLVEKIEGKVDNTPKYRAPELDYDTFLECVCRCGFAKYAEVPMMTLTDKVAGFLDNLMDKHTEEQVIIAATEQATPPMFDAVSESVPLVGEPEAQFAHWLACWERLKLSSLYGYPLWLREVHELLHSSFRQLRMIFSHYCTVDNSDEDSASGAQTLGGKEWLALAHDCRLANSQFTIYDLKDIFRLTSEGSGGGTRTSVGTIQAAELNLPGMIEALVRVAFLRANPGLEGLSEGSVPLTHHGLHTLPGCLIRLFEQHVLPLAKQDSQLFMPEKLAVDEDAQALLKKRENHLKALMSNLGKSKGVASSVVEGGKINLGGMINLCRNAGLLRQWRVPQTSEVTGDPANFATHTLSLTSADVRVAFVNSTSADRLLRGQVNPNPNPNPIPNLT